MSEPNPSHYADIQCVSCGRVVAWVSMAALRTVAPMSAATPGKARQYVQKVSDVLLVRCSTCATKHPE